MPFQLAQDPKVKIHYTSAWKVGTPFDMDEPEQRDAFTKLLGLIRYTCEYAMIHMFDNVYHKANIMLEVDHLEPNPETGNPVAGSCSNVLMFADVEKVTNLTVRISPDQSPREMISTLFHELQHAAQVLEGRLYESFLRPGKTVKMWNGRAFSTRIMQYRDWPWEVEARDVEHKMLVAMLAYDGTDNGSEILGMIDYVDRQLLTIEADKLLEANA